MGRGRPRTPDKKVAAGRDRVPNTAVLRSHPPRHTGNAAFIPGMVNNESTVAVPTPSPPPCNGGGFHQSPRNIVFNQCYDVAPVLSPTNPDMGIQMRQGDHSLASSRTPRCVGGPRLVPVMDLAAELVPRSVPRFFGNSSDLCCHSGSSLSNQGAILYGHVMSTFGGLITAIDRDRYTDPGRYIYNAAQSAPRDSHGLPQLGETYGHSKSTSSSFVASLMPETYLSKVDLYTNSRLPLNLPPMKLYLASYRLLSLAAKYSDSAYLHSQGAERSTHIGADWRAGTKAMVIKSLPMDDANTIIFAIRGTADFMDWAVNLNTAPSSPVGFLDDTGNLCHAGFLSVARKMIHPVATRLRQLLEEDPGRASYSLLITGHSAGGAVASLLYAHMVAVSSQAESELNLLTGCFRRIHCITFGAPPISLLPLKKPDKSELAKSLFFGFVNEGDPVVRADREYVRSLMQLFTTPAPRPEAAMYPGTTQAMQSRTSTHRRLRYTLGPVWEVPPSALSNAGRIVVLRSGSPSLRKNRKETVEERLRQGVVAQFTSDDQLRKVIWGDPLCHAMKLYAGRVEVLSIASMIAGP